MTFKNNYITKKRRNVMTSLFFNKLNNIFNGTFTQLQYPIKIASRSKLIERIQNVQKMKNPSKFQIIAKMGVSSSIRLNHNLF